MRERERKKNLCYSRIKLLGGSLILQSSVVAKNNNNTHTYIYAKYSDITKMPTDKGKEINKSKVHTHQKKQQLLLCDCDVYVFQKSSHSLVTAKLMCSKGAATPF